jgi:rhomboid protease GluP
MFRRQRSGSVVCVSCGYLVGVNDAACYHCGRKHPGLWGFGPVLRSLGQDLGFVPFVTGLNIIVYLLMLLVSGGAMVGGSPLSFLAPSVTSLILFGAAGSYPVFTLGRWWTLLSASWLHASLLHILFNLLWIRQLAPDVGELYGAGRLVIIYTVAGMVGFLVSSIAGEYFGFLPFLFLQGGRLTVGASASIFGLLGALVYYGRRTGSRHVHAQAMTWAVITFVFGLVMPGVDNYAHVGGFVGGYLAGRALDPLKPERIVHLLAAVICLAAAVLAIAFSVFGGLILR